MILTYTLDESMFGKGKYNRGDNVNVPMSHEISRVINERMAAVSQTSVPPNQHGRSNMIVVISINLLLPRHVQSSVTRY